jgi:hypothetical protein
MELSKDTNHVMMNMYFKDQEEGESLMSGLPLPKDSRGGVCSIIFIECEFHCNCCDVTFVNCCFYHCELPSGMHQFRIPNWPNDTGGKMINCSIIPQEF